MKISAARTAAYDVLLRIENEKAYSSILLPLAETGLALPDRALCHELTLGTLRRQIYLDRVIDLFSKGKKIDIEVRIALRMALYQIYFLDRVPAYSAINESVNLIQRAKKTSAKGFVNAILRRATREPAVLKFENEVERISVETSHPRWLVERWIAEFGMEEASSIAKSNNELPGAAFRLTRRAGTRAIDFANSCVRSIYASDCFIGESRSELTSEMSANGEIYFQDEASQIAALAVNIPAGGRFLDVCAAPGSKTGLIANKYSEVAGLVVAGDLHRQRTGLLKDNCSSQGVEFVDVIQYDAVQALPFADGTFDVVLADVPCSGTGTIRHNPELRYLLLPEELVVLSEKQLQILMNASKTVRRGGTLIYSTCSLEREENEEVCTRFMSMAHDFVQTPALVPPVFLTADGYCRMWPQRDQMDGFFIAAFSKIG